MRLALTKRTDYAIRAFLCLARSDGSAPVSSRRIAEAMDIPPHFLPHVLGDLARAGLVEATNGKHGGYRLARRPEGLSLLEVIEAVEGPTVPEDCALETGPCAPNDPCAVHHAISGAQQAFVGALAHASLADIVGRPSVDDTIAGRTRPERTMR